MAFPVFAEWWGHSSRAYIPRQNYLLDNFWEINHSIESWDTYVAWDGTEQLCAFNFGMLPCSGGITRLGHFRLHERSWHTAAVNDRGDRLTHHVD